RPSRPWMLLPTAGASGTPAGRYASRIARPDDIERLEIELGEMFTELWHGPRFSGVRRGFRPKIDVIRTEEPAELRVVVDLAGVDPADVHVVVAEQALVGAGQGAGDLRARAARDRAPGRPRSQAARARVDRGEGAAMSELAGEGHGLEHELEIPTTLPVLPLKETVVFPQSMTPLAIGQERSIKLIDDVVSGNRMLALLT